MSLSPPSAKFAFADFMRLTGAMAVVLSHSASTVEKEWGTIPMHEWWAANLFCSSLHWGVPAFLMLSGSLLLKGNPDEPWQTFLQKRFHRVLYPFIGWAIVYGLYNGIQVVWGWKQMPAEEWIKMIVSGMPYYHMWFMSSILGLYLLTPMFRKLVHYGSQKLIAYFLFIWFFSRLGQYLVDDLFVVGQMEMIGFIGCFVLGHYVNVYGLPNPRLWYGLGIGAAVATAILSWEFRRRGLSPEMFFDSLSPFSLLKANAVFLWYRNHNWQPLIDRRPQLYRRVIYGASIGYGIYLAHILVMEAVIYWPTMGKWNVSGHNLAFLPLPPVIGIPILAVCVFVLSVIVLSLWKKIPVLNKFAA